VNGTPTFFVNGVRHAGAFDVPSLLGALEGTPIDGA
jgi:protein-disulfide isomerase